MSTTYYAELSRTELLTAEQEIDLAYRVQQGDKTARDLMVCSNLRLVVKIAQARSRACPGADVADLISDGNIGLIRAVDNFDPSRGVRFATHASYWIKQSINRALDNTGRTVRLPAYMVEILAKWKKTAAEFATAFGYEASPEELGTLLGLTRLRLAKVKKALASGTSQAGATDSGWTIEDLAEDMTYTPGKSEVEALRHCLDNMDPRQAEILRQRFGINPEQQQYTLREIAVQLGMTSARAGERVRQLERLALSELYRRMTQD